MPGVVVLSFCYAEHDSAHYLLSNGLFVLALTALFAFVNWHWLRANVVTYGWDRLDHLITSLVYREC
jgi:hypothetical protein